MRKTCLDMVCELARKDPRVFFIGSDLGEGTLDEFKQEMPDRFLMEGISEANVVGLAAGLALEGRIVYVNTIATFLTRRCFEQIVIDLCLHDVRVRLIGSGGGLVYGPLGPTHEAFEDLAILRCLPRMTILTPADAGEMRRLMPSTVDHPGPIYIRLGRGGDPLVATYDDPFEIGRGYVMRQGAEILIATTGVMLDPALKAASNLADHGQQATVLHLPSVKPLDRALVLHHASRARVIVAVEEHSIVGGLGSAVAEIVAEAGFLEPKQFRRIGLPDAFPDRYGTQSSQLTRYGLTAEGIASEIRTLLDRV